MPDALFINWIRYHGRSASIAEQVGIPVFFVHAEGGLILRYARQASTTARLLREHRPRVVVLMQPPVVALIVVKILSIGRKVRVIGDLHSGVFVDRRWQWATNLTLALLRGQRSGAIVTNRPLAIRAERASVRVLVAHDPIIESKPKEEYSAFLGDDIRKLSNREFLLVPLAYANDEPVLEIIEAARTMPDTHWVFTGRAPASILSTAPSNIQFTGYVSLEEYSWLVESSTVMVALTTRDLTMQRVGYEAMSAGRALVTSARPALMEFFEQAAVYSGTTVKEIAKAVREALDTHEHLESVMKSRREYQIENQERAISDLRAWIDER